MGVHHRFRLYFSWDFAREEAWVNKMAQEKGLYLTGVGCCHYTFTTEGGPYRYRLEPLRRTAQDQAEKQYLRTIGAEEVCKNGEWAYYRIPSSGAFSAYSCADSKLAFLQKLFRHYLIFGVAVYLSLLMAMTAFFPLRMTPLHTAVVVSLLAIAVFYTVELTRFQRVLRSLRKAAEQETF